VIASEPGRTGAIVEAVRLFVTLATTAGGFLIASELADRTSLDADVTVITGALLGAGVGYVGGGVFGRVVRRMLAEAPKLVSRASGPELFAGAFGLGFGVFVGVVLAVPVVVLLPPLLGWPLGSLLVLVLASFGSRVFAERSHDLLAAFGLRPRDALRARRREEVRGYLVDSSAAIDGRVLELARAGLIGGAVSAPLFVVDELQGIADSGDRSRRRRGRRGLDVLDSLRSVEGVDFSVHEDSVPLHDEVDAKLIALTADLAATLVTTDHNLAKAAQIRGLRVLNPHSLGESMRPALVSGDRIELTVEREGSEPGQGVGFLDDGTMVVVEGGSELVGQTVLVEVANSLRTSIGRLMFARLEA
jgi:uncharacterized protein YacL